VGGGESRPGARALKKQFSKSGEGMGTVCKGTIFRGEGCHKGVTVGGWGVAVRDWSVTVGVVVTVEFITVFGAWRYGFAEQGGKTQPPMSPRENMDLKVGPGSP